MDIIGAIDVDVSELSIGNSMQAVDIQLGDKHTLISSPDTVIASVTHAMREEETAVEEDSDTFMDDESGEASSDSDSEESTESK